MNLRRRIAVCLAAWAVALVLDVLVNLKHYWWFSIPLGFLSVPVCYSITMRLIVGEWPKWGLVWQMLRKGRPHV